MADVPPSLARLINQAVAEHGGDLHAAGDALLEAAKGGGPGRETALTLLAADALVTYACEFVAESSPERLGSLQ